MAAIEPDRMSLEIAHKRLALTQPLDEAMKDRKLSICIKNVAKRHMQRRSKFDAKKLQSGDVD